MTVHVLADEPALLRNCLPLRAREVETATEPDSVRPDHGDIVVCRSLAGEPTTAVVRRLATDADAVVFVYETAEEATAALDAGAVATVPDPADGGSTEQFVAAVERLRRRVDEVVSPVAAALDDHPDLFFAFSPGGEMLEWNDTLSSVTGYSDAEIAEMTPGEFFGPAVTPEIEAAIGQAFVDGRTDTTAPIKTADGETVPFEFTARLVERADTQAIVGNGRRLTRGETADATGPTDVESPAVEAETPGRSPANTQITVSRLFSAVIDAVVGAETRETAERAVCEAVTREGLFRFAWIGGYDTDVDRVEPRAWAGDGQAYLDERPEPTARTESQKTALSVVSSDEPVVVSDIASDDAASIWRAAAMENGHRAAVGVPIKREETTYGCLSIYAARPGAFDDIDPAVFDTLGALLGYAVRATEIRRSLVADTAVEIQFEVVDPDAFITRAAKQTDGRLDLIDAVERPDGAIVQLFTVRGIPADVLRALTAESPVPVEVIADRESEVLARATIDGDSMTHALADVGGEITSITAENGSCRVSARVPETAEIQAVIARLDDVFDIEPLSKRTVSHESLPDASFKNGVTDRLTDRQLEVIRMAYNAGFFEWPRELSGDEMAELLDVSAPTFHQHRRAALSTLLGVVFDDT